VEGVHDIEQVPHKMEFSSVKDKKVSESFHQSLDLLTAHYHRSLLHVDHSKLTSGEKEAFRKTLHERVEGLGVDVKKRNELLLYCQEKLTASRVSSSH